MVEYSREWEKRSGREAPESLRMAFAAISKGFEAILTVGTEESIQNHPELSNQIPENLEYHPKRDRPEDAPFSSSYHLDL